MTKVLGLIYVMYILARAVPDGPASEFNHRICNKFFKHYSGNTQQYKSASLPRLFFYTEIGNYKNVMYCFLYCLYLLLIAFPTRNKSHDVIEKTKITPTGCDCTNFDTLLIINFFCNPISLRADSPVSG